jgi:hypothetical protein
VDTTDQVIVNIKTYTPTARILSISSSSLSSLKFISTYFKGLTNSGPSFLRRFNRLSTRLISFFLGPSDILGVHFVINSEQSFLPCHFRYVRLELYRFAGTANFGGPGWSLGSGVVTMRNPNTLFSTPPLKCFRTLRDFHWVLSGEIYGTLM